MWCVSKPHLTSPPVLLYSGTPGGRIVTAKQIRVATVDNFQVSFAYLGALHPSNCFCSCIIVAACTYEM
jgi:hypothetical protein